MRRVNLSFLLITLLLVAPLVSAATSDVTAKAGKYTVELLSQPSPPVVGENMLLFRIRDGEKPLNGAGVKVHLNMTTMLMPAELTANPDSNDGEYGASVNLSMAGKWKLDVAVQQMAGMDMAGDGTAHFTIETGKGITGTESRTINWFAIIAVMLACCIAATIAGYRRIPQKYRGKIAGGLTILVILVTTVGIVQKYRNPKTSTIIGSSGMDMSTKAAPGTSPVITESAHAAPFLAQASYTGLIAPDLQEDISSRISGRLIFMPFYPGDQIAPGQVVARLDANELTAKESQAAYGSAGAEQGVSLANADAVSARAAHEKAERLVDQAKAQLAQIRSTAHGAELAMQAAQSDITRAESELAQAQSNVASAQADVTYWNSEIAREKHLFEVGAVSREEYERETAQAAAAHARLSQINATVRAAEAGVAGARARYEQARADAESAKSHITEAEAGVKMALADVQASEASISGATAKIGAAQANALQARAALTEASTIRGYSTIRSAIGGVVTARNIAPGVLVQPGSSILKIAKIDMVRLQVNVSEADLGQIQIGQRITAHQVGALDQLITGHITSIFPAQDPSAHMAIVEARISNPGRRLKPGGFISVDLSLGNTTKSTFSVPSSAVISRDGHTSVFVATNDGPRVTAKRVDVQLGRFNNTRTEILSGLREGDEVIISGLSTLHDGDVLSVVNHKTSLTLPQF